MRFFLKVEFTERGEVWEFFNEDLAKVSEILDPNDPSLGRLVKAAAKLEKEAIDPSDQGPNGPGETPPKAWLVFTVDPE
ncbi:hypothetical protein AN478_00245 [Thiohalorhabdus denitrificans]|uniref:Uncharacterized protein n=1 Tax=Thiohalorhabdus denitrificans TaxID=381306 RepID=A0A0P9EH34_9GAMM|nr:hypothetical protein [Thiohalorhabdus denitrificans]KPV41870.1 hypothetical protein AN478_00245 [Thiohalorhabdus denitrificans]SCY64988.1 hypothetical protein SAMN05661077_0019 [Thiohalorhabdus denitrificans]